MRSMPSRNRRRWIGKIGFFSYPMDCLIPIIGRLILVMAAMTAGPVAAADFLSPLPLQELTVGKPYSLGIRPSRAPARSTPTTKLDLYADGVSARASFLRIGDEMWELVWNPTVSDRGVHSMKILVAERGSPTNILETLELTFVVNDPAAPQILIETASLGAAPVEAELQDSIVIESASALAIAPEVIVEPIVAPVPEPDPIEWTLAPISSHVVTANQWIRFPVNILSEQEIDEDAVVVQIDRLPNGASFDPAVVGGRQFQWRPGTADRGDHTFRFTAVDRDDASRRESVTMRIIVTE